MQLDNSKPAANTCLRHVSRVPANSDSLGDGTVAAREQGSARLDTFTCKDAASPTFLAWRAPMLDVLILQ